MTGLIMVLALVASAALVAWLRRRTPLKPGPLIFLAGFAPAAALMAALLVTTLFRPGPPADALALMMIPMLGAMVALAGWAVAAMAYLFGPGR